MAPMGPWGWDSSITESRYIQDIFQDVSTISMYSVSSKYPGLDTNSGEIFICFTMLSHTDQIITKVGNI